LKSSEARIGPSATKEFPISTSEPTNDTETTDTTRLSLPPSTTPTPSGWECRLFGAADGDGLTWRPYEGNVPNFFWRFMQFVFFGNRWSKVA